MTKRKKFVISSIILSVGFLLINFLDNNYRFWTIAVLTLLTLILSSWSLYEGLAFNTTLLTLILQPMFTLGVGIFWFLLPSSLYARLPVVVLYGIGNYALFLTANIFTVSAIRTIALSRAAKGVSFVLTLLTSFLLFDSLFSLRSSVFVNAIGTFAITLPLFLQGLWQSLLEGELIKNNILTYSIVFGLLCSELSALLYFWPVTVVVGSLFMTVSVYVLLGLGQAQLEARLFKQTAQEYLIVGTVVFLTVLFATKWG
ncbi:MAG: hypothetical protein HY044_04120 [Candidatus Woesebacteria bacterium]|nr:MAG: hypothetical protein HY044_04120 [Candidatus Woesebacteria bacterium]